MAFWEKLKPIKMKMKGIRSNVCAQFGQKNSEIFVNFEQRGSADNRILNWEFFMSGLKCCFDLIKIFLND